MSEKRFEVVMNEFDEVEYIMDKVAMEDRDFAEFIDFVEDVCKENEQLEKSKMEIVNDLGKIFDENEQLQFELKECNDNRRFSRRELKKENERIKHIIQEAYETERTAIGKNVLKQLLNNIGETNE